MEYFRIHRIYVAGFSCHAALYSDGDDMFVKLALLLSAPLTDLELYEKDEITSRRGTSSTR